MDEVKPAPVVTSADPTDANDDVSKAKMASMEAELASLKSALTIERAKKREVPHVSKDPKPDPTDSVTLTKEELNDLVKESVSSQVDELRSSFVKDAFSEELTKISPDPVERDAIVKYYKERVRPSGVDRTSILRDLRLAKAGIAIDNGHEEPNAQDAAARAAAALGGGGNGKPGISEEPIPADIREMAEAVGIDPVKLQEKSKRLAQFYAR